MPRIAGVDVPKKKIGDCSYLHIWGWIKTIS